MKLKTLVSSALLLLFSYSAHTQKLYVAENGATQIQRSGLDGSGLELISGSVAVGAIRDMVIDELENYLYWIENDASFARVKRAKMSPTAPGIGIELINEEDFILVLAPTNQFEGLAIDPANRNLYITNQARIERVSLDNPAPITVLAAPLMSGLFQTFGIDVDRVNDKIYFVNQATTNQIQRANLDGTSPSVIVNISGTEGAIQDVAVEPVGGNLYFTTVSSFGVGEVRKTDLLGTTPFNVGRTSLTGVGDTNIITGLNNVSYIAIDLRNPLADKMYWSEEIGNYINRADRDGTNVEEYYTGFSNFPQGVAYDYQNNYIFWTDRNGTVRRGQIGETGFFNSEILINQSFTSARPNMGISLDISAGKMYWASNWDGSIKVADFNDPSPISTLQQIVTGLSNPRSVAVDPTAGKIYYTENVDPGNNIAELHQANLDGSGDVVLFSQQLSSTDFLFTDVKLDLSNNTIYWSGGQDDDTDTENFGEIFMADLGNVAGTVTSFDTNIAGEAWGIDLDIANGHIYWVNRGFVFPDPPIFLPRSIMRANLDGSNMVELVDDNFLTSPYFIALNVIPAAPPACAAIPASNAGSDQLVCGTGAVALSGSISNAASASWSSNGDGIFANANNLATTYTPGANDLANGTVLLTLTTADPDGPGPCMAAASSFTLSIDSPATINAGADQFICPAEAANLSASLGGSATNPAWATSGDGSFDNISSPSAIYTPGTGDIGSGSVTLTLTADAAGVCPQVTDQLAITIAQNPVAAPSVFTQANVQQPTNIDIISASITGPGDVITVTIIANGTQGNASIQPNNTINYTPNPGTVGADAYQYRLCNQCNLCSDGTVTVDILNEAPVFLPPAAQPSVVIGQSISLSVVALLTDINNNLDLTSFTNFSSAFNASFTYTASTGALALDYSTATVTGPVDQISFTICDQLNACTTVALQITLVGEINVFNGVSANGDQLNPVFELENIEFLAPVNKVTIYNRWGDKVFEIENYDNAQRVFSGQSDDGDDLPSGIYFYRIEFPDSRPKREGYLSLKR